MDKGLTKRRRNRRRAAFQGAEAKGRKRMEKNTARAGGAEGGQQQQQQQQQQQPREEKWEELQEMTETLREMEETLEEEKSEKEKLRRELDEVKHLLEQQRKETKKERKMKEDEEMKRKEEEVKRKEEAEEKLKEIWKLKDNVKQERDEKIKLHRGNNELREINDRLVEKIRALEGLREIKLHRENNELREINDRLVEKIRELEGFREVCVAILTGERVNDETLQEFIASVGGDILQMHVMVTLGLEKHLKSMRHSRHLLSTTNRRGWIPLFLAAARGDTRIIKLLWESTDDLQDCVTFLHVAAANRNYEAAKFLMRKGVNKSATYKGCTASQVAAVMGDEHLAMMLEQPRWPSCLRQQPSEIPNVHPDAFEELTLYPWRHGSFHTGHSRVRQGKLGPRFKANYPPRSSLERLVNRTSDPSDLQ